MRCLKSLKKFGGRPEFGGHRDEIRQFVKENSSGFVDDLSEVTIIKKYRRNKISARIPVKEAQVVSAVQGQPNRPVKSDGRL